MAGEQSISAPIAATPAIAPMPCAQWSSACQPVVLSEFVSQRLTPSKNPLSGPLMSPIGTGPLSGSFLGAGPYQGWPRLRTRPAAAASASRTWVRKPRVRMDDPVVGTNTVRLESRARESADAYADVRVGTLVARVPTRP